MEMVDQAIQQQYENAARSRRRMGDGDAESHPSLEEYLQSKESDKWRMYGQAHRRQILDEDRRKGGTKFNLNASCSVERYFQVAKRALEQFHGMYDNGDNLEETYIMGHRMVSFLTECLPNHPDFQRPRCSELRSRATNELERLWKKLDDLALQIDEEQCNKYVADYHPPLDEDSFEEEKSEKDVLSPMKQTADKDWVSFGGWSAEPEIWKKTPVKVDSPSGDTVATTGTGSVEPFDLSSEEDDLETERQLDFSSHASSPVQIYEMDLGTEFLDRIASEDVRYESDSDAADSWAQDDDSVGIPHSSSSATGITCDPARLAFRDLLRRIPTTSLPIQSKTHRRSRGIPPASVCEEKDDSESRVETHDIQSVVESEIRKYINSSSENDPAIVIEASMERLRKCHPKIYRGSAEESTSSQSSDSASSDTGSSSSAMSASSTATPKSQKENEPQDNISMDKINQSDDNQGKNFGDKMNFLEQNDDEWVTFDTTTPFKSQWNNGMTR